MGWFLVNIIVPIVAPILGVLVLWATPLPNSPEINPIVLVKDGQLGWVAMALCAAALYDYTDMIDLYANFSGGTHMPAGWHFVLAPLVISIIGAVLVAALGAIYSTPELKNSAPNLRAWLWHYKSFVISVLWTVTSAVTFALIHLYMLPTATQWRF